MDAGKVVGRIGRQVGKGAGKVASTVADAAGNVVDAAGNVVDAGKKLIPGGGSTASRSRRTKGVVEREELEQEARTDERSQGHGSEDLRPRRAPTAKGASSPPAAKRSATAAKSPRKGSRKRPG